MSILRDLRVVEVSGSGAAALAAKHFADWGAEVTILEPAAGSPLRQAPPYYERAGERRSGTWAWLSRGKTAVRVGQGTKQSVEQARAFCLASDICFIESELAQLVLGLRPTEVHGFFEGRTTCVLISPFAPDGPYADYRATDIGLHALGGWMGMLGDPAREPLRPGNDILWRVTGAAALTAGLIALRQRRLGHPPQYVDLSTQAVAASMVVAPWLIKSMSGIEPVRRGNRWPQGVMECADGFVGCSPLTATHWELLCHMMGIDDVLEEPGGREPQYREQHADELYERVKPWLGKHTRNEIFEIAQGWRLPSAPVQNVAERLECPQLAAREFFVTDEVDGVTVRMPRVPYLISGLSPAPRAPVKERAELPDQRPTLEQPAPEQPAPEQPAPEQPATETDASTLPLAGIRVVDLTWFWSGPFSTKLLGALGADVIKVESIQRPDSYRYTSAPAGAEQWYERGPLWNDANNGKRGVTLDLNQPEGIRLLEQLIERSDIVISNFSNRVMPNLGLTNDRLLSLNPRLIAVTMPGYGPGGPWENYVGYGVSFEQLAVCASVTGYADGSPTIMGGFSDPTVGLHTVAAIELALMERERTGKGTAIEIPQAEVLESIFAPEHIAVQLGAPVPRWRGNQHDWIAPHNAYQVAGQDQWLTLAVGSDGEFQALAQTLGRPDLATDDRFATAAARKAHEPELDHELSALLRDADGPATERRLQEAGVAACRVTTSWRLPEDANLRHIGFFQPLSRAVIGDHLQRTWPFRFSGIDARHKRPAPLLGEHNREVLGGFLGLSNDELARLETDQVIGSRPVGFTG